jgi:hypothetical protein
VPRERVPRLEALDVAFGPDLFEIVHSLTGDVHRAAPVLEQIEIGPSGGTDENHVAKRNLTVLQHEQFGALGDLHRLLDRPVDVSPIAFMIPGDIDDRLVRHVLKQPKGATFHLGNQVAGDDHDVELRPLSFRGQVCLS